MAKNATYNTYYLWRSMPSILKGQPKDVLNQMGIGDAMSVELLELKTQAQFSERFGVSERTLNVWNKKVAKDGLMPGISEWAKMLTNNVMFALYQKTLAHGDAARVEAWMNYVEGQGKKVDLTLSDFLSQAPGTSRTDDDSE